MDKKFVLMREAEYARRAQRSDGTFSIDVHLREVAEQLQEIEEEIARRSLEALDIRLPSDHKDYKEKDWYDYKLHKAIRRRIVSLNEAAAVLEEEQRRFEVILGLREMACNM